MGQVGWGFVVDQANTETGSATDVNALAFQAKTAGTSFGGGVGGSSVINTYNGPLNNLLIRPYLFANGEQGWWYDPSDFSTLFQDAAGTTPVTAVEQPCSLMLDKRLGLTLGPELWSNPTATVTNGTGTYSQITSTMSGTAFFPRFGFDLGLITGRRYVVTGVLSGNRSAVLDVQTTNDTAPGECRCAYNSTTGVFFGIVEKRVIGGNDLTGHFWFRTNANLSPITVTIDNISVRELPGNHAFTPAAASTARPTVSARVNLLTKTEQFDDAAWTKSNLTASATTITDSNSVTAVLMRCYVNSTIAAFGVNHTCSIEAKAGTRNLMFFGLGDGGVTATTIRVDLSDGSVIFTGAKASNVVVTLLSDGYYRISLVTTPDSDTFGAKNIAFGFCASNAVNTTGDGTGTILVRKADLRVANDGVGIPNYQRVNTATDYDTVGFPVYLRADGSNDFLQTNSIDFTGTDKMTLCAGVRKLSDAAAGTVMELSTAIASNNGTFRLTAPNSAAANYAFASKGTVASTNVFTSFAAPITNVITGLADISGDINRARLNAQSVGDLTSDQGTGNFGNFAMYLFSTAGTSSFFNGRFYGGVVRGAFSNDQQVQSLENYMNTKTAAFAPTTGSFAWNSATSTPATAVYQGYPVVTTIHQGMRRCLMLDNGTVNYYLDPLDSTKKADGTASVLTGADGQVMVEIPAFYTRRTVVGTVTTWEISQAPQTGFTIHPAFVKDGVQVPFRYYSAYDACVYDVSASSYIAGQNYDNNSGAGNGVEVDVTATTGDVLASVSGVFPMVGLTRAENRTIAANRGTGWRQLDWTLFSAVQLLYLIEFQSFFSQNILGAGNTGTTYATTAADPTQAGNGASEAGKSNSLGNGSTSTTTGASSASRQVAFMSYRGIENFYGNDWNWADGVIVNPDGTASANQGDWWFTNNSADFSDSVRTNMTQIMSTAPTTSGFASAIASVDNFFIATSVSGGSSSTYLTDQYFGSTSADRVVRVGGGASSGAIAGAFGVIALDDSSDRYRLVGARLAY